MRPLRIVVCACVLACELLLLSTKTFMLVLSMHFAANTRDLHMGNKTGRGRSKSKQCSEVLFECSAMF
jgi:hypothetical protein